MLQPRHFLSHDAWITSWLAIIASAGSLVVLKNYNRKFSKLLIIDLHCALWVTEKRII